MPLPDEQTSWEAILEFRNDSESIERLRALRVWARKFSATGNVPSLSELKDEIETLLDEYEQHMRVHKMSVNKGALETVVTITGAVAENLAKLKFGELAKLPFILRQRRLDLLKAELQAPHRELAFISMARSRFRVGT
jgi:predicted ATPase